MTDGVRVQFQQAEMKNRLLPESPASNQTREAHSFTCLDNPSFNLAVNPSSYESALTAWPVSEQKGRNGRIRIIKRKTVRPENITRKEKVKIRLRRRYEQKK